MSQIEILTQLPLCYRRVEKLKILYLVNFSYKPYIPRKKSKIDQKGDNVI